MVEKGLPIDMVVTADTGMEFPEMYGHLEKLDRYLYRERGLHITILRHPHSYEWLRFDTPLKQERAIQRRMAMDQPLTGYGWPGLRTRWCTSRLKTDLIEQEVNRQKKGREPVQYIGIAADETKRCKEGAHIRYPLTEWGITEVDALRICYDRGFDFGGLYETYRRASCWCCPFQRIGELRKLRAHHPELWERLRMMGSRAREQFGPGPLGQFKPDWSVQRLEERFAGEEG